MPFVLGLVLEGFAHAGGLPKLVHGAVPALAEVLRIWAIVGVVWLVGREILEEASTAVQSGLREGVQRGLRDMARLVAKTINDKDFLPPTGSPSGGGSGGGGTPPPTLKDDPKLAGVRKLFEEGKVSAAIDRLQEIAATHPEYLRDLLTVLTYSQDESDWRKAIDLLASVGEFTHYMTLAFKYWSSGDPATAIMLCEKSMSKAKDKFQLVRAKNNLAYYLADARRTDRAGEAQNLIEEAIAEYQEVKSSVGGEVEATMNGRLTSTLGFVRITFAADAGALEEGIRLVEQGRAEGSDRELFFRHIRRAAQRSAEIGLNSATV